MIGLVGKEVGERTVILYLSFLEAKHDPWELRREVSWEPWD
jgi:hypothetical protein